MTGAERLSGPVAKPPSAPGRIQLRRVRGWRIGDAVKVDRATRWGNPFTIAWAIEAGEARTVEEARLVCVGYHEAWLAGVLGPDVMPSGKRSFDRRWVLAHLPDLAGRDLADWCPPTAPGGPDICHARNLMRRAAAITRKEDGNGV